MSDGWCVFGFVACVLLLTCWMMKNLCVSHPHSLCHPPSDIYWDCFFLVKTSFGIASGDDQICAIEFFIVFLRHFTKISNNMTIYRSIIYSNYCQGYLNRVNWKYSTFYFIDYKFESRRPEKDFPICLFSVHYGFQFVIRTLCCGPTRKVILNQLLGWPTEMCK